MTIHRAKGLEFPVVFIVGVEEGLIPILKDENSVEFSEERRIFYVGMTRAKELLYLTYAKKRLQVGYKGESRYEVQKPSRFLGHISKDLVTVKNTLDRALEEALSSKQDEEHQHA